MVYLYAAHECFMNALLRCTKCSMNALVRQFEGAVKHYPPDFRNKSLALKPYQWLNRWPHCHNLWPRSSNRQPHQHAIPSIAPFLTLILSPDVYVMASISIYPLCRCTGVPPRTHPVTKITHYFISLSPPTSKMPSLVHLTTLYVVIVAV